MRQVTILLLSLILLVPAIGQPSSQEIIEKATKYRNDTDEEFRNIDESPLPIFRADEFTSLPYFDIDTNYYVTCRLVPSEVTAPFKMKTTTDRIAEYGVFGTAHFLIGDDSLKLTVYESIPEAEDDTSHLFLPFMDETNGEETYGGGRYVSVDYPKGDTLFIDFNEAYNPYCAYSERYSCPLVPRINRLKVPIRAGVKYEKKPTNWGVVEQAPEYPGGPQKLFNTLFSNMTYPKQARKEKVEGTVYIGLIIAKNGTVDKREVLQGFNEDCDNEALKATESLRKFKPALKDGKPVREQVVLPVRFKL